MDNKIDKNDYKPLKVSECVVGNIVILTHPNPGYSIGTTNPKINTRYYCEGVIHSIRDNETIEVLWNNGSVNYYRSGEISLARKRNIKSIW